MTYQKFTPNVYHTDIGDKQNRHFCATTLLRGILLQDMLTHYTCLGVTSIKVCYENYQDLLMPRLEATNMNCDGARYIFVKTFGDSDNVYIKVPRSKGGYREYRLRYGELASWVRDGIAMMDLVSQSADNSQPRAMDVPGVGRINGFRIYRYQLDVKGALRAIDHGGIGQ